MNLIEQLGGYEKAKIRLGSCDITTDYYQELDRQLLEYRRANNIFEVGDKVTLQEKHWFGGDGCDGLFVISEISGDHISFLSYHGFSIIPIDWIRHTTPEEIKAGKRL